jgi:hypothetical protein
MKTITLKDIIAGQKVIKTNSYNTDLFKSDNENITDEFTASNYEHLFIVEMTSEGENLKETIIGLADGEAYLINARTTTYNGEPNTSITQKVMTLQGFNYFTKEMFMTDNSEVIENGTIKEEIVTYYNQVIKNHGYEITYDDILELGELSTEYNVTILSFEDNEENKHFLTINDKGQLSKITVKQQGRAVKAKAQSILNR